MAINSTNTKGTVFAGSPLRAGESEANAVAALVGSEEHAFPDVHSASLSYATRFEGSIGKFFLDVQRQALERHLNQLRISRGPVRTALDVGGGHGQTALILAQLGIEVTVVGSREDAFVALDQALSSPAAMDLSQRITKVVAPLFPLPFATGSFDLGLSFRIIPHLTQWQLQLRELSRVATKGVIFDYPSLCSVNRLGQLLFFLKQGAEKTTRPYLVFDDREIAAEMAGAGWQCSCLERQFIAPMALHRALRSAVLTRLLESCGAKSGATARFGSPVVGLFMKSS